MADERSRLERAEQEIYSRGSPDITKQERTNLSPHSVDGIKSGWTSDEKIEEELTHAKEEKRGISFVSKFFVASIVFFLAASGVAAFMILGGFNVISSKNVDITVRGPSNVAAGEEAVFEVEIHNNNNVDLEDVKLLIEYPQGTREPTDLSRERTRTEENVGGISSGRTAVRTVRAVFFGEKDNIKQLKISIDYKAKGSNARFNKEKTYDMAINSSPIVVTVDYPKEINANQEIDFNVTVTSNSTETIQDLLMRAEYPFGFVFISSNPSTSFENNIWNIGDLEPKETKHFVVRGKVEAQNDEERTVRFIIGLADQYDERKIAVDFLTLINPVTVKKPFIGLAVRLNQSEELEHSVQAGGTVNGRISWTNNLPVTIDNAEIELVFSGSGFDKNSVDPKRGFFRSSSNRITWDRNSISELRSIGPGSSGSVEFSFDAIDINPSSSQKNISTTVSVDMRGTRVVEGQANQTVSSESEHTVKIATEPDLASRVVRTVGPFENSGPIPPRADQETTYTILWTLTNSFNDLGNTVVSAKLPVYVDWKGISSPSGQIHYDESTRTVSWTAGEVKAGTGYTTLAKEVAFQVGFTPSTSQIGSTPTLIEQANFSATDRFTGKQINLQESPLNIRFSTDPNFDTGDDKVTN